MSVMSTHPVLERRGPRVILSKHYLLDDQLFTTWNFEDVAIGTSIIVFHHQHTNVVCHPDLSGSTQHSLPQTDSTTMTAPDISTDPAPSSTDPKPIGAPRSQPSFNWSTYDPALQQSGLGRELFLSYPRRFPG